MATFVSEQYKNGQAHSSTGMSNTSIRCYFKFPSAVTLAAGDIIKLCKLPPNHAVVGITLDTDVLGTAAVGKAGLLNTAETAVESASHTESSLATKALLHANTVDLYRLTPPQDMVKTVGIEITTAASAALSAGAIVGAIVTIRPRQTVE